jgi:uncharacterized protein
MRRILRSAVLSLAILSLAAAPAVAQRFPAEPGDGVADLAGVLSPADEAGIRAIIGRMRANPGVEVAVLTVRSVGEYGAWTQEEFATGVYNSWRLGEGQRQDGVLVLLSVDDRFTRIELGDGVPAEQDARMAAIVEDVMVPRFRGGDMGGGLHDGVLAVANAFGTQAPAAAGESGAPPSAEPLAGQATQPQDAAPVDPQPQTAVPAAPAPQPAYTPDYTTYDRYDDEPQISGAALFTLLFCGVLMASLGAWIYQRTRKRKCAECGVQMVRLTEADDDVYLDSGRLKEEVLGSVNYDVWHCPGCGVHAVVSDPKWSRHDRCGECGYRTVATTRAVVEQPTYDSSGSEQIEKACAHCGWTDVDVIHLPRKQRPQPSTSRSRWDSDSSSSWGSGSSSWGGGSSRGSSGGGGGSSGGGRSSGGSSSGRGSSGRW